MELILSRVPARSVARWRMVCTSWKLHLTSPEFLKLHTERGEARALVIGSSLNFHYLKFNLDGKIKGTGLFGLNAGIGDELRVHNSSYGLFLVSSKIDIPSNFYVVNLCTGELRKIVCPISSGERVVTASLCFQPNRNMSYRLLFLVETTIGMDHNCYNVILYSSYGRRWSSTPAPTVKFQGGVFHKEILYWITDVQGQALTFHLETKNWATISLPETPTNRFCRPRLVASNNFLHYFITRNSIEDLCVYEMTDSGGWIQKFKVEFSFLKTNEKPLAKKLSNFPRTHINVLSVLRDAKGGRPRIIILVQGFVTCYDPEKQQHMFLNLERRFPVRGADVSGGDVEAFEVTDSLVPV
ncbi:F-box domain containing protein [Trema orientale]|uniref:F-box domain containing protein n=1 Tax=Trema orientale TaxID=63057 RepID=A0A2P5APG6_TREOI|nr:F-box domain containing protein [Trema orientale]